MREYWINVYSENLYPTKNNNQGMPCESLAQLMHVSKYLANYGYKTLYRIHVKMKSYPPEKMIAY